MKGYYTTIPVNLCEYALVNRKINQVKVFIYLKFIASGHISYNANFYEYSKEWAKELELNYKTIRSSIEWLVEKKWITINSKKKSLRVIGYRQLHRKLNFNTKSATIYESETLTDFKAFCSAVVVTYYRNRKKWFDKRSASNTEYASKNCANHKKGYYPISNGYLAKCLKVCKTTAYNIKKEATKFGFITKKKNLQFIYMDNGKRLTISHLYLLRSVLKHEINIGRIRKGKKYIKYVDDDLIQSEIKLKKKYFA